MALANSFVRRMRAPDPALPFHDRVAFSLAALPGAAVLLLLSVYLPRHIAGHLGIPLALVGGAFFIVRLIDIPVEAVLGWLMDATRTPRVMSLAQALGGGWTVADLAKGAALRAAPIPPLGSPGLRTDVFPPKPHL